MPQHLFPGIFVSGSSAAGLATARALGATAIQYPKPGAAYAPQEGKQTTAGLRIGIIADNDEEKAWQAAYQRFPADRKGRLTHQVAMKISDSVWHRQLSEIREPSGSDRSPYWLWPFQNYQTFCPYLVGSFDRVSDEIARWIRGGFTTFILDIPRQEKDLFDARTVFDQAMKKAL